MLFQPHHEGGLPPADAAGAHVEHHQRQGGEHHKPHPQIHQATRDVLASGNGAAEGPHGVGEGHPAVEGGDEGAGQLQGIGTHRARQLEYHEDKH